MIAFSQLFPEGEKFGCANLRAFAVMQTADCIAKALKKADSPRHYRMGFGKLPVGGHLKKACDRAKTAGRGHRSRNFRGVRAVCGNRSTGKVELTGTSIALSLAGLHKRVQG
jgi:hypothetical protein